MDNKNWLIYGAYGYTGTLIAEEAVCRGHKPVLAGRNAKKLAPLAESLDLKWMALDLRNEHTLREVFQKFKLVFNTAGPFTITSLPMVNACLDTQTNYVDVAGEISVLENIFSMDQKARQKGIVIMPGLGFDVIATDCMAKYVAEYVNAPNHLEIGTISSITTKPSPGTMISMLDSLSQGTLALQSGQLIQIPLSLGEKRVRFIDQERTVLPATLGDLVTAYKTTEIPNIITYIGLPDREAAKYKRTEPLYRGLLSFQPLKRLAQRFAKSSLQGPGEQMRRTERSQLWVCARNEESVERQAWLETLEAYQFTAVAGVRGVENIFENKHLGVLTPGMAFGAGFVLNIPGTRREDSI